MCYATEMTYKVRSHLPMLAGEIQSFPEESGSSGISREGEKDFMHFQVGKENIVFLMFF